MAGQHLAMTIYQYDIEGNFIKEWDSQIDITVYFDLNTKISRVVDSNKPYRNCFWSTIYYMKHPISKIINDKDLHNKKTFNVFSVLFLIVGFILFIVANDKKSFSIAIAGYIISLLFWIIATADDITYKERNIKTAIDEGQRKHGKTW